MSQHPDGHGHAIEEKEFSASLDELKKEETGMKESLEHAQKKKESAILKAKEDAQKDIEKAKADATLERKKILEEEIRKIDAESANIIKKAEKEADAILKGKDAKKVAEKLLPLVLK